MIDRPQAGERAVLVHINFSADSMQEDLLEFEELARSAGADVISIITGARAAPDPKFFIGTGKADELRTTVSAASADVVLVNHALTPAQERNLEKLLQCRVVDRTGLILDIFAQRARSFEGKLQVELAYLNHLATRLVRGWTHLERQRGGIGLRGGPGETQLELDRRLIRDRVKYITKRLQKVRQQREQSRRARRKAAVPTAALVGYTNAGKSTLFNHLTGSSVYAADRLFATLDPTLRRIELPEIGPVILADTVGFIRHLPHDLIDAFHATLEEVIDADLLLHVVDAHDANRQANIEQVNAVLTSIQAEQVPQLLVFNKIDLCPDMPAAIYRNRDNEAERVCVSASTGAGLDQLQMALVERLSRDIVQRELVLSPQQGRLRAELYRLQSVLIETTDPEGGLHLTVRLPRVELERLLANYK